MAGLLGVLKAEGTYVVLEPDSPDTLRRLLDDARPGAVVTTERHLVTLEEAGCTARTVCLDAAEGPPTAPVTAPRQRDRTPVAWRAVRRRSGRGEDAVVDHAHEVPVEPEGGSRPGCGSCQQPLAPVTLGPTDISTPRGTCGRPDSP
ncbi:hypothetical protein ACFQZC_01285 [Streptacidiphilus monticola]